MNVAILAAREGWHTRELQRALAARGHRGAVVPYEGLVARLGTEAGVPVGLESAPVPDRGREPRHDGVPAMALDRADAVLARIIPAGSLEQIIFRVDALHWLERRGVRVLNPPRAIERTVDKFYASALLQGAGLPTPRTVVCERPEPAMAAFRAMGDVVFKPLFGSMGLGMVRATDEDTAWRVARALEAIRAVYYVQQTIDHPGLDLRAFVVGDRVLGAIERMAAEPGGWRTNVSRGGRARPITLAPRLCELAVAAARAVGAEYAGVDLLPGQDGRTWVLEVNGIPGWRGLQGATGLDVAGAVVGLLDAPAAGNGRAPMPDEAAASRARP